MAAKKKVEEAMVVDAALNILRNKGYEALNVRSIAGELNCSTKPIYYIFGNMDGLLERMKDAALEIYAGYVRSYMDGGDDVYRAHGMAFIRFAKDEKELFRYLYLNGEKGGKSVNDAYLEQIYDVMEKRYGYTGETAEKFHRDMSFFTYGIAMMINIGYLRLSDEEIGERLHTEFMALTSVYGPPPAYVKKQRRNEEKYDS